jgi:hypothetical protein
LEIDVSTFVEIHQILVPEVDLLFEAAAWVARLMLSTFVVEATSRFPEETNPLQS